jgi:hypothetical protein
LQTQKSSKMYKNSLYKMQLNAVLQFFWEIFKSSVKNSHRWRSVKIELCPGGRSKIENKRTNKGRTCFFYQ